jgi:hypothetical protein
MGREIKRVPLDFDFPLNGSYHDHIWDAHRKTCPKDEDACADNCERNYSPPRGEGWQLWQTVSDGPISPVFKTAEELIDWMCQPEPDPVLQGRKSGPWAQGWHRQTAERFVRGPGWAPSFFIRGGVVVNGVEYVTKEKGEGNG